MPSFIETQFPIARLSAEAYKERKANNGQTLTRLGKWWGRKPLILVRASILGMLMPASGDPKRDREEHDRLAIDWLKKMTSQMKPEWWEPMGEAQRKKVASAAAKAAATWPREVQEAIFQALQSI